MLLGLGFFSGQAFAQQTLTAGVVKKHVYQGVSQEEVIMAIGSPNIITQDSEGRETWVYDKMSSVQAEGTKLFDLSSIFRSIFRGLKTILTLGLLDKPDTTNVQVSQTSQNTLTVIIKFDKNNLVESCSYHSSRF